MGTTSFNVTKIYFRYKYVPQLGANELMSKQSRLPATWLPEAEVSLLLAALETPAPRAD
jgi:hypothetical protein